MSLLTIIILPYFFMLDLHGHYYYPKYYTKPPIVLTADGTAFM